MNIHRCRFVDYTPHSVTAIAFSHSSNNSQNTPKELRVAIGRSNGDIEIWSPHDKWVHELTLPGGRGRTVEGLVWGGNRDEPTRLFSIGGSSVITEWDLCTLRPRYNYECNGGIIWSIDVNEDGDKLAVGCDDGSVVVVDILGGRGSMEHVVMCQRQEQRVLGLSWMGKLIIGGCADAQVRIWDSSNGRSTGSVRVDRSKTEPTLVWAVMAIPELNQFVTGDSTGAVKFWHSDTLTLLHKFSVHEADVLTLARVGERVFSAGIDRKIHQFTFLTGSGANGPAGSSGNLENAKKGGQNGHFGQKSQNGNRANVAGGSVGGSVGGKRKWIHNFSRLLHANDVRAMAAFESSNFSILVSGGVERCFIVQELENFEHGAFRKFLMDQQISSVAYESTGRLLALFQDQSVRVWAVNGGRHALVAKLSLADDDNVTSVSIGEETLGSCLMAVATITSLKLFWLHSQNSTKRSVEKIRDDSLNVAGAKRVWVHEGKVVVLTPEDDIVVVNVNSGKSGKSGISEPISLELPPSKPPLVEHSHSIRCATLLPSSPSSIVLARFNDSIHVVPITKKPSPYALAAPAVSVHLLAPTAHNSVTVLTHDGAIYDLTVTRNAPKLLTPWSERNSSLMPRHLAAFPDKPMGMFVANEKAWVYGCTWLAFVDLRVDFDHSSHVRGVKRTRDGLLAESVQDDEDEEADAVAADMVAAALRRTRPDSLVSKGKTPFWFTQKYRPILKVASFDDDIVVVERDAFALPAADAFDVATYRV